MIAAGIDIGGTKIEAQIFDQSWAEIARRRVETPDDYDLLVRVVADQIAWAEEQARFALPVGIGAAGLINPQTGLALTANLPATGQPFPRDLARAAGRGLTYINDCRALALSEAVFGAGRRHRTVMGLIMGTGIGGGIVVDQSLAPSPSGIGGEFGHISSPAHIVAAHDLPIVQCGCGRVGCIETYISGPGLQRIAAHVTGVSVTPKEIAAHRTGDMKAVWDIWCALVGDLICTLTLITDPDIVVLGGGLSHIEGITDDIAKAAHRGQMGDFIGPEIVVAQGGDASGARGAAFAAATAETAL